MANTDTNIRCRLLDHSGWADDHDLQPGDMWWMTIDGDRVLMVQIPGDECNTWYNQDNRWTVTGEPPNITVSPSIYFPHEPGGWHGWLRDGVLVSV